MVEVNRVCNPNLRIQKGAFAYIEYMDYPNGDMDSINFEVDETSKFVNHNENVPKKVETIEHNKEEDVLQELHSLVGLSEVKQTVDNMIKQIIVNQKRLEQGLNLNKKNASVNFGQEAIDTIMKYMEDYRDEIMIIFAGYTKEMDQFLKTNPGLASRVPNRFLFEDFTGDEIVKLGQMLLAEDLFVLSDKEYYSKQISKAYNNSLDKSNGRWIRNFNEKIIKEQSNRIVNTNDDEILTIRNEDIDNVLKQGKFKSYENTKDAMEELNKLIGIVNVKGQIQEFINQVEINKKKEDMGIVVNDFTLHSLFLGNPGTGKTTVARIIGKILYQKGIIATNKFIEVSRSDLVAGYVGQTSMKTREVLESALGGVLFIDEAYSLNSGSSNDFGKESIEEILKFMEDHRRDIVIILAGYTKEMAEFLQMNSGLKSRIPNVFEFEDYNLSELVQIGLLGLKEYNLDEECYASEVEAAYDVTNDHSNGRQIRNFNEKLLLIQFTRLIETQEENLDSISNEDIIGVRNKLRYTSNASREEISIEDLKYILKIAEENNVYNEWEINFFNSIIDQRKRNKELSNKQINAMIKSFNKLINKSILEKDDTIYEKILRFIN